MTFDKEKRQEENRMMKRTRALLVLGSFLLILSALIYIYVSFSSSQKTKESQTRETHVYDSSLKDIVLTEDKRYVLVSPKNSHWQSNDLAISRNYLISTFVAFDVTYSDEYKLKRQSSKLKTFEVLTYDLRDKKFKENRIDLKKAVEKYTSTYQLRDDGSMDQIGLAFYQNGKDYVRIHLSKKDSDEDIKTLLLDLETGQLSESNEEAQVIGYNQNLFPTLSGTNLDDILRFNGFSISNILTYINEDNEEEGEIGNDINFSVEFPTLVKRLKKNRVTKILYRKELVPPSDYYEDLSHWFAPVGQDKLDIIGKDFDTQVETPLNTYQEFIDWSVARSEKQDERMKAHGEKTD